MPIAQFEGKALVFNNGVVDVVQGDTSLVDENKVAHIPEGNVLIDNETIIKNANNQLEIPIDEDTIYIDEHGFMKAKGGESSEWSPIELSSEGGLYFKNGGLAIKTGDSLEIVDNEIKIKQEVLDAKQDTLTMGEGINISSEGVISVDSSSIEDYNPCFQWKMDGTTLLLYYGLKQPSFNKYVPGAFAGLAPTVVKFDKSSMSFTLPQIANLFEGLASTKLKIVDITNDSGNNLLSKDIKNVSKMFKNCTNLILLDMNNLSLTNETIFTTDEMFYNCSNLGYVKGAIDTSYLFNPDNNMFYNCTSIMNWDGTTDASKVSDYIQDSYEIDTVYERTTNIGSSVSYVFGTKASIENDTQILYMNDEVPSAWPIVYHALDHFVGGQTSKYICNGPDNPSGYLYYNPHLVNVSGNTYRIAYEYDSEDYYLGYTEDQNQYIMTTNPGQECDWTFTSENGYFKIMHNQTGKYLYMDTNSFDIGEDDGSDKFLWQLYQQVI